MTSTALKLKASFYTLTVLQFYESDLANIESQLQQWIKQTPQFFRGLPVIIDLQYLPPSMPFNLAEIRAYLCQNGFVPIGIQGGNAEQQAIARELQLALFPTTKEKNSLPAVKEKLSTTPTAKVIRHPVRSGQEIYAKGDLIVIGSVSPGAELLAEGHIHIYGKLSGRALAGISDNKNARIFCQEIEAELVAIAGHYWLHEDLQKNKSKSDVCLYLENEQLHIQTIKA